MENAEEVFHLLEEFSKLKPKTIPQELNDYLAYVARTGDPVYQWSLVKSLFKEKLLNVITDFYETTPGIEIPPYPNVDPFNYDVMKNSLLERLDSFTSAPFTIQRICELLAFPRKQYNRVDKFMRAIEKNILVVSTREPGIQRHIELENGEPMEPIVNGSDNNSEYNVDVEMEDVSWKDNSEQNNTDPQPSSSDTHISVDNTAEKVHTKLETQMDTQDEVSSIQESAEIENSVLSNTPPDEPEDRIDDCVLCEPILETPEEPIDELKRDSSLPSSKVKEDDETKSDDAANVLIVPEIKIDDAEMTEQKLKAQYDETTEVTKEESKSEKETEDSKPGVDPPQAINEDSCSSSNSKEDVAEPKMISEVSTSSEESSSSSDNTDGNSNSPRTDPESQTDVQVGAIIVNGAKEITKEDEEKIDETPLPNPAVENSIKATIQTDNYSISDVNSEIQQIPSEAFNKSEDIKETAAVEEKTEQKLEETGTPEKTEQTQ